MTRPLPMLHNYIGVSLGLAQDKMGQANRIKIVPTSA